MTTLVLEKEPAAALVTVSDEQIIVSLVDGRILCIPITWYPRIHEATPTERGHVNILGDGYALEWPDLDEHIGVEGLFAGRRSGESKASFERWLGERMKTKP